MAKRSDLAFITAARLAGLLHDLGKYRFAFQDYLNAGDRGRRSNETDHAVYGAAAAEVDWRELADRLQLFPRLEKRLLLRHDHGWAGAISSLRHFRRLFAGVV